jgi:hypothetical protein
MGRRDDRYLFGELDRIRANECKWVHAQRQIGISLLLLSTPCLTYDRSVGLLGLELVSIRTIN